MKNHLQEHVPQLIVKLVGILLINGVYSFVRLFYQIFAEACVGLLGIPWAAVFSPEPLHYLYQLLKAEALAAFKGEGGQICAGGVIVKIFLLPVQINERNFLYFP